LGLEIYTTVPLLRKKHAKYKIASNQAAFGGDKKITLKDTKKRII